jgi:DNA-binding LacI/PurR family transcriptional regulator
VHKLLTRAGIKIGTDLELIGCNNEQETLAGLDPRPATIDVGIDMICYMAVERLLMSIKNQAAHSEGVVISVKADTVQGESNKFDLM